MRVKSMNALSRDNQFPYKRNISDIVTVHHAERWKVFYVRVIVSCIVYTMIFVNCSIKTSLHLDG